MALAFGVAGFDLRAPMITYSVRSKLNFGYYKSGAPSRYDELFRSAPDSALEFTFALNQAAEAGHPWTDPLLACGETRYAAVGGWVQAGDLRRDVTNTLCELDIAYLGDQEFNLSALAHAGDSTLIFKEEIPGFYRGSMDFRLPERFPPSDEWITGDVSFADWRPDGASPRHGEPLGIDAVAVPEPASKASWAAGAMVLLMILRCPGPSFGTGQNRCRRRLQNVTTVSRAAGRADTVGTGFVSGNVGGKLR